MFYEIYADRDVSLGGLWFNPADFDVIEITDLGSAMGGREGEGVTLIERGSLYVNQERLEKALKSAGLFEEERPPSPPKGRKHWFPRPWEPTPKRGYLFWMPDPIPGPKVLLAWANWGELQNEGVKFEELPEDMRGYIFMGVEPLISYYGTDRDRSVAVIEFGPDMMYKKRHWGDNSVITKNPERATWKVLENFGVERDVPVGS